ncbi:MAG: HAD-IC family P-type ATPase, partial [Campylobacteraceae bacterium]
MKTFTCIHQSPKRRRYKCPLLESKTDINNLIIALESLNDVTEAKVNIKAKSFTLFNKNGFKDVAMLEKNLQKIDFSSFTCKVKNTNSSSLREEPSTAGLIRAASALVVTPLAPDNTTKMAISTLASAPLMYHGVRELVSEGLTSKVLEAMAVGVSLARRDFTAANSTNALLELGEYIEETTVQRSDDLVKELSKPNIEKVWVERVVKKEKILEQIPAANLKIGDIVVVGVGETIAVDGHIVEGNASVNQVSMTGEAEPVKKSRGDRVISGVIVDEGRIKIWAEQVGDNTATARIKRYILSSLEEKSSIGLKATKLADKLVPVTLGLAAFSYLLTRNTERLAAVLQADYSCALKLATPVAFKSAIAEAGKNGILIKGAKVLEALSNADTFVFDKTGTLTKGTLEVLTVNSYDENWSEAEILNLTASTEEHYFHPVAEAVVKAARDRGFIHMHHDEVEFIVAHGVKTSVNNKEVVIGSRH